jgi:hypothetical protein
MPPRKQEYTYHELRVLWYLKRHGGAVVRVDNTSILTRMTQELPMVLGTLRWTLRKLEERSLVLRTYKYPIAKSFADQSGANPLIKVELVDPKMALPPEPQPPTAQAIVAFENRELDELTAHEPERNDVIDALVDRAIELQRQVDKLQDIISMLEADNAKLRKRSERAAEQPAHLSQRVRDVLTAEKWEELRHNAEKGD